MEYISKLAQHESTLFYQQTYEAPHVSVSSPAASTSNTQPKQSIGMTTRGNPWFEFDTES